MFGLGYVGAVSGSRLARDGREIVGADAHRSKVQSFNAARTMMEGVRSQRIRAMSSAKEAVNHSEISTVCVGAPSFPNLNAVEAESSQIGARGQSCRKARLSRLAPIE